MYYCSRARLRGLVIAWLVIVLPLAGQAHEGFWPFNRVPKAAIKQASASTCPTRGCSACGRPPCAFLAGLARSCRRTAWC